MEAEEDDARIPPSPTFPPSRSSGQHYLRKTFFSSSASFSWASGADFLPPPEKRSQVSFFPVLFPRELRPFRHVQARVATADNRLLLDAKKVPPPLHAHSSRDRRVAAARFESWVGVCHVTGAGKWDPHGRVSPCPVHMWEMN